MLACGSGICCDGLTLMFFPGKILGPPWRLGSFGWDRNQQFLNTQRFYMYSSLGFPAEWTYKKHIFRLFTKIILEGNWFPPFVFVFFQGKPPPPRFSHFSTNEISLWPTFFRGFASKVFTGLGCLERGYDDFLGGGNSNIFYFHPYLGKVSILTNIFQRGWNHQPVWMILEGTVVDSEIRLTSWAKGSFFPSKYKVIHPRWLAALSINSILLSPRKLTYPPWCLKGDFFFLFEMAPLRHSFVFRGCIDLKSGPNLQHLEIFFCIFTSNVWGRSDKPGSPRNDIYVFVFVRWALKLASGWWVNSYLFSKGFRMATTSDIILSLSRWMLCFFQGICPCWEKLTGEVKGVWL